jgi:hypothetical protein
MISIRAATISCRRLTIHVVVVVISIRLFHLYPRASASCHTFNLCKELILAILISVLRKVVLIVRFVRRGWKWPSAACVLPL